jgi:PadR family transcriptional regulator PadR
MHRASAKGLLRGDAYGVLISREIAEKSGREVALASVYAALERLERKGFVASTLGEPTAERGGKARTYFVPTESGVKGARNAHATLVGVESRSAWPRRGNRVTRQDPFTQRRGAAVRVPPRLATWLLLSLGSGPFADALAGDLSEEYQRGRSASGIGGRWRWLCCWRALVFYG